MREVELSLSVDMLTTSREVLAGSVEPDLAGEEGIFAPMLDFFPAGSVGESLLWVLDRFGGLDLLCFGLGMGIT